MNVTVLGLRLDSAGHLEVKEVLYLDLLNFIACLVFTRAQRRPFGNNADVTLLKIKATQVFCVQSIFFHLFPNL